MRLFGVLFHIGGLFLIMGGSMLVGIAIVEGQALSPDSLGVVLLTSGAALVLIATMIVKDDGDEEEENYRSLGSVGSKAGSSRKRSSYVSQLSVAHICPSCSYVNNREVFFCDACNSPMWPEGTPRGRPLAREIVERRRMMIIARRNATKILLIGVVVILATTPVWGLVVTGYVAVNATQLTMRMVWNPGSGNPGTVDILAVVWGGGVVIEGELMRPSFTLTVAGAVVTRSACSDTAIYASQVETVCTISTIPAGQFPPATILTLSMNAILRFGLYQTSVIRSTSSSFFPPN